MRGCGLRLGDELVNSITDRKPHYAASWPTLRLVALIKFPPRFFHEDHLRKWTSKQQPRRGRTVYHCVSPQSTQVGTAVKSEDNQDLISEIVSYSRTRLIESLLVESPVLLTQIVWDGFLPIQMYTKFPDYHNRNSLNRITRAGHFLKSPAIYH